MSLPRMPEDAIILDMIRAGVNTIPRIAHKIYGHPEEEDWIHAKTHVLRRMNNLEKYGMIRRTDKWIQMGCGRNMARVWEVIE